MTGNSSSSEHPQGMALRHTLRVHLGPITTLCWSPDGEILASAARDGGLALWDPTTGKVKRVLSGQRGPIIALAWSPDGNQIASASQCLQIWDVRKEKLLYESSRDIRIMDLTWSPDGRRLASGDVAGKIDLWDAGSGARLGTVNAHESAISAMAWAPRGDTIATASADGTLCLSNEDGLRSRMIGHHGPVYSLSWSPDGKTIASGAADATIRIWEAAEGRDMRVLEGHTGEVISVAYAPASLMVSKAADETVRLWRCDTWEEVAALPEACTRAARHSCARFRSGVGKTPAMATLDETGQAIRIWDLHLETLIGESAGEGSTHYTNAKVCLLGDSGVGKSGLGLVLSGEPFAATESTHGRHVWILDSREVPIWGGRREWREMLLWDLAGQPGYRLIHQLYLDEVAVALVLFDARSETDPFAGVLHWDRALRLSQRLKPGPPLKKFLVAARTDRGGRPVSRDRIQLLMRRHGFDAYFETSAKEGWGVPELTSAIRDGIDWASVKKVSSSELFQRIKNFLVQETQAGRVLSPESDLYKSFAQSETGDFKAQFETCIGLVESRGLIRRLSFGGLVLLQPEKLDAYASAIVNAAKNEPDGLGHIPERHALKGQFQMPDSERICDPEEEKLLLVATVEELLRREIALREDAEEGAFLVFPSQMTRQREDLPDPAGKSVVFEFEGPVVSVYATLAVRLSHSGVFNRAEMWKNAATYSTQPTGTCGMVLREPDEGRGELCLFFDERTKEDTRLQFEEYVRTHLERRALQETVRRRRVYICSGCQTPVTDLQARRRKERGLNWMECSVCGNRISLLDRDDRRADRPVVTVAQMDQAANAQRDRAASGARLRGKILTRDFDVFLCYNNKDKTAVMEIGGQLKERGILPWLDVWELRPGLPWQMELEDQIERIKCAAVFVGAEGLGPWQQQELMAFLRQFVNTGRPVIPVMLGKFSQAPKLPVFLETMTWVDFTQTQPDPLEHLMYGITGERRHAGPLGARAAGN